ncbi:MAG: preprotein translocase subunit YajC [Acidiferrobacter sp.]
MIHLIANAYAAGPATPPPEGGGLLTFLPIVLVVVVFYFLILRPQNKRQREQKAMIDALAVGDEVVMGAGMLGRIVDLGKQYTTIEIANGVNVKVQTVTIQQVLPKDTIRKAQ